MEPMIPGRKLNIHLITWPYEDKMYCQVYDGGNLAPFKKFLNSPQIEPYSADREILISMTKDLIEDFFKLLRRESKAVFSGSIIPEFAGQKISVHVRYWPKNGDFAVQFYPDVDLGVVSYSGAMGGSRDPAKELGGSEEESIQIIERVFSSIYHGIINEKPGKERGSIQRPITHYIN